MNKFSIRIAAAAAFAAASLGAQAGTELLVNGSFEQNVLRDGTWTVLPSLVGWQADATSGVELRRHVAGEAQDGAQFVELDTHYGNFGASRFDNSTNSAIWQVVDTETGGPYHLSFWYSARAGISAASNAIEVWWNDTLLDTVTGNGIGRTGHVWSSFSFDVIGTGHDRIRFAAAGTQDSLGGSLDNVSLQAAPIAAVPEPQTWALMAGGLALLAGVARRRRT